jgi:hypothetical protein
VFCSDVRRANKRLKSRRSLSSRCAQMSCTTRFPLAKIGAVHAPAATGALPYSVVLPSRGARTPRRVRQCAKLDRRLLARQLQERSDRWLRGLAMIAITVSFVAFRGTAVRTSSAPRSATGSAPAIGATPLVSRSPGRLSHPETGEKVHSISESLCR